MKTRNYVIGMALSTLLSVVLVLGLAGPLSHPVSAQGQTALATQDTFTAAGSGSIVNVSNNPVSLFAIQLKGTGAAATTATCTLQGSLDGVNFTTVLTFGADGVLVWQAAGVLNVVTFYRTNCTVITLGPATNVVARVVSIS